jgi:hypothetical protein
MAKKTHDDEDDAPVEKAAAKEKAVKRDPLKVVGLETAVAGEYTYLTDEESTGAFEEYVAPSGEVQRAHVRSLAHGGKHYEHTREDGDGVWIYRQM